MINFRFRNQTNSWPGFVDLFSNLVIILIFLLIVFVFLWTTTSVFNKKTGAVTIAELKQTNEEQAQTIRQMTDDEQQAKRLLITARAALESLEKDKADLSNEIQEMDLSIEDLISAYEAKVADLQTNIMRLNQQLTQAELDNSKAREEHDEMVASAALLNEQLEKLRTALSAAEEKSQAQEAEYIEMSTRLNKALADKVAELNNVNQYQSEFYKAIKVALGDNADIKNDGDRFIVSSDILFPSGSYKLGPQGKEQLKIIAGVIKSLEDKIPTDINWIIRVDGHTDNRPVVAGTRAYSNNVELSLRRATAVADFLGANGVAPRRLVPSGFGDMYPVELGNDAASLQKNRRIELQLTNR